MTTTAFQPIFDRAETISIVKRGVVSSTVSRNQTVRTISDGAQTWKFSVTLPDGIPWTELRNTIEKFEYADRYTVGQVQLNTTGTLDWFMNYQGEAIPSNTFNGTGNIGDSFLTLTAGPAHTGFKFKAGDLIQPYPYNHVYSVSADVMWNATTIPLHRPLLEAATNGATPWRVGPDVVFNVLCTEMPSYTIFARNQVSWSGPFIFVEDKT